MAGKIAEYALKELRGDPKTEHLPIIVISA